MHKAHSHTPHQGHTHDQSHAHHQGHAHCLTHGLTKAGENQSRLGWAALITGLFMLVEIIGGVMSGSLALIADAGHMLTDFAALSMAWAAFIIARRPAHPRFAFGYDRVPVMSAFINGLTLFAVALWVMVEGVRRFVDPGEVLGGPMLIVAIMGLCVNIIVLVVLLGAERDNLNIRGALLHVVGDMLGSVAAIIAAGVIVLTGWMPIDPLLSMFVALIIMRSAWILVRDSGYILLGRVPIGIDQDSIRDDIAAHVTGVHKVDSLTLWPITQDRMAVMMSVTLDPSTEITHVRDDILSRLGPQFRKDDIAIDIKTAH